MISKVLLGVALTLLIGTGVSANTGAAKPTAHKAYEQKLHACRKEAKDQGLRGEEGRSHVAACMKR